MFHAPEFSHSISLRLSQILDECGLNEIIVQKRRRANLLQETLATVTSRLNGNNWSDFRFGSQTEGATTIGLQSDIDDLGCLYDFVVIQNWSEWQPGVRNLLIVQTENTYPGYCFLQELRKDIPLPFDGDESNTYFMKDTQGRTLLRNTIINTALRDDQTRQGPSLASRKLSGICDQDNVPAFFCKSWPQSAKGWLHRQSSRKLTQNVLRTAANDGCFLVAIGSKVSECSDAEWRISASLVERSLMFTLNITQLRCYVLMKMIIKTYINKGVESLISSYMCKTVLLHLIEKIPSHMWRECDLLKCLTICLLELNWRISAGNCPQLIIPENNLMVGKYATEIKQMLKKKVDNLIKGMGRALLGIIIDDFGHRLQNKLTVIHDINVIHPVKEDYPVRKACWIISGSLLRHTSQVLRRCHDQVVAETTYDTLEKKLTHLLKYRYGNVYEQASLNLLSPLLYSTLGSRQACIDMCRGNKISQQTWIYLTKGLTSDATSSKLKMASVFYYVGDFEASLFILHATEGQYVDIKTEPVCACGTFSVQIRRKTFGKYSYTKNEEAVKDIVAFCTKFFPYERDIVPRELRKTMFRSFLDTGPKRDKQVESAAVDSLSYIYFLQFKACTYLNKHREKSRALNKLIKHVNKKDSVEHKEIGLNLLGLCMESEDRYNEAFQCYMKSLDIGSENNAAKLHVCELLAKHLGKI